MANYLSKVVIDNTEALIKDSILQESRPINVLTLGIKNDGVTDCTALINKYTAEFPLFFPSGKYLISGTINVVHSLIGVGYSRNSKSDGTVFFSNSNDNIFLFNLGDSVVGNITFKNIGVHCNANNSGIQITTRKYIRLENIGVFTFGNMNDGAGGGSGGYRYGIKMGDGQLGQSRSIVADNITITSNPNSPTYGIYTDNIYDANFSHVEIMFCRKSVAFVSSLIKMESCHLWCGNTDYTSETKDEFLTTRCITLRNTKFQGTDIYTDCGAIALTLAKSQAYISNYINWYDTEIPYDNLSCDIVYQESPSYLKINNGMIYVPNKFFKNAVMWNATQVALSNINYIVDADPTQYSMWMPKSYDSHFTFNTTGSNYNAFLMVRPINNWGEYVQVRCFLSDNALMDIYVKNNSHTLNCTTLNADSVPVYYKKVNGCIVFYAKVNMAECNIVTSSHNCTVYKLNEFTNMDNTMRVMSQADNTGLTLLEKNKDITIA